MEAEKLGGVFHECNRLQVNRVRVFESGFSASVGEGGRLYPVRYVLQHAPNFPVEPESAGWHSRAYELSGCTVVRRSNVREIASAAVGALRGVTEVGTHWRRMTRARRLWGQGAS
jgi:hypothetical protein